MSIRRGTNLALACLVIALIVGVAGCGGNGNAPALGITITNCDTTTFATQGVICVDFFVTGIHAGPIGILAQFTAGPGAPLETATEIPPSLAAQLGVTTTTGPVTTSLKFATEFRFCWYAGADLGFVPATGVTLFLTPVELGTTNPIGGTDSCGPFNFGGGGQTQIANGPPLAGRAGHCDENIGGKSIMVAGGFGPLAGGTTPLNTLDRLTFNTTGSIYTKNGSPLQMQSPRTNQACSFFLDPTTEAIKVLITGGDTTIPATAPTATADVYCFTPTEQIMPSTGAMNVARRMHTATWIPSNKVVIIGGSSASAALCSIEIWDPLTGLFQLQSAALSFCREGHSATLLPTGKILVAGGHDPNANVALPAELYDPVANTVMTVPGPFVNRIEHTATRLANGWVLLAGGFLATSATSVTSSAQIFEPELGSMGEFTSVAPLMTMPRALHASTLLGDGHVLLTGGQTAGLGCPVVSQTAELFLPQSMTFTPTISMANARADHSSTPTSCGFVAIVGGTNDANCLTNFISSVEVYPFDNQNPVIVNATDVGGAAPSGNSDIFVFVTDEDGDGGYVIIRYRVGGVGPFLLARITGQGSTTPTGFPSMQVAGLPATPVQTVFRWNWGAQGLTTGQSVQVEVLPVGATLGTPVHFTMTLP